MLQKPGGWQLVDDPKIRDMINNLTNRGTFTYPVSKETHNKGNENWEMISLQSSEFDESLNTSKFSLLPVVGRLGDSSAQCGIYFSCFITILK